ncbi:precorrin-3B synthase [Streptomyces longispororuber]|uniref:precorrin-3B synthase n=1 Tax=Streptomyces longispororuber TaxID=68230 RepID=UPI0036FA62A3
MLAAMSTAPLRTSPQATAAPRDRGDACPGSLRLHAADDGALARVRVPGGVLSAEQAEALAGAAHRLGDGDLHLTSRGNVQLRGLGDGCGADLAALLGAAGLLPSAAHERVRNVVASPLSGLDGRGLYDVRPWLTALDAALCASAAARELSGRFLFALDDGRGDVAALDADVTVRAAADGRAVLSLDGAGPALRVPAADAPRAALLAAEAFAHCVRASGAGAWRVAELASGPGELLREVRRRLAAEGIAYEEFDLGGAAGGTGATEEPGAEATPASGAEVAGAEGTGAEGVPTEGAGAEGTPAARAGAEAAGAGSERTGAAGTRAATVADAAAAAAASPSRTTAPLVPGPPLGIVGSALSVHAPLGRLTLPQWRELIRTAAALGPGELRLTPWRGVVVPVPGAEQDRAAEALDRLAATGLVSGPASPWPRVGACAGRPGCAKSRADVRADAARTLAAASGAGLPLYWSGCERRCGRPRGDRVDLVAAPGGGYHLTAVRQGRASDPVPLADPTRLATALAAIGPV